MKIKSLFLLSLVFIYGNCSEDTVKLLKKSYFKTEIGTVKNHKFIKEIKKEKESLTKSTKLLKEEIKKEILKTPNEVIKKKPKTLVQIKKENYRDTMVPIVTLVYKNLEEQYKTVKDDIENNRNKEYIEVLKKDYDVKTNIQLLQALKPHPISIVLAQGAIESAWLTSRFAINANNIFGVWSFNKEEPRIVATGVRGEKKVYLKKYKTLKAAVEDYYKSIAKSWAYDKFRYLRTITNDPYLLIPHMTSYSEKGEEYTKILEKMIKSNKFYKYDIK